MTIGSAEKLNLSDLEFAFPESKIQDLKQIKLTSKIVGQDRAISALEMGLGISAEGYNIFIMGAPGTGRRTVLSSLIKKYKPNINELQDIAYAFNFTRTNEPQALYFPAGEGKKFQREIKKTIDRIHKKIVRLVNSETFSAKQKKIAAKADAEENGLLSGFETKMLSKGFHVVQMKNENSGTLDLIPLIDGEEIPFNILQTKAANGEISEKEFNKLRESYYASIDELSDLFSLLRKKRVEADKELKKIRLAFASPIINTELKRLVVMVNGYRTGANGLQATHNKKILDFLKHTEKDLLSKLDTLSERFKNRRIKKNFIGKYCINLVCENSAEKNYAVEENLPIFSNLFGTIEAKNEGDERFANGHLRIRAGAVHRASGGYLIIRLRDILEEDDSWIYLKRVLLSGKIEIQMPPSGNHAPTVLKPEPLPVNFKAIIIGGQSSYDVLYQDDPDFYKLFKVCAEFDSTMLRTEENTASFIALVNSLSQSKKTLPLTNSGYARIISFASELSECRHLLSAQFTKISDLITEADYIAKKKGKHEISDIEINDAIENRHYLHSLPENKFEEMVKLGDILIDVSGTAAGKVNGLAVEERGYHTFGVPVSVTAQASPGKEGIINIEREAGLSGEIYDKAHLIIVSLLRKMFAGNIPLSVNASICFEQSYSFVDGDSASCAEFFALLSAIADIPLRQDIAVTGSLNQHGKVQPVGGITEKISGFFNTCKILGLTGTQGVIIPYSNKNNLFLPKRILEAAAEGKFNVWAIKNVDEGMTLLSGLTKDVYTKKIVSKLKSFYETTIELPPISIMPCTDGGLHLTESV